MSVAEGPIIHRRRKTDCGEDLVAMHRNLVRVPMGKAQAQGYRFHLKAEYLDKNGQPALGAKPKALRLIAAKAARVFIEIVPAYAPLALRYRPGLTQPRCAQPSVRFTKANGVL